MKRDKALGQDPLAWIKITRGADSEQAGEVSKSEEQETPRLEATHPEIKKSGVVEHAEVEEAKWRPATEKPQPVQKTIEARQESIPITHEQDYPTTKEGFMRGRGRTPYSLITDVPTTPFGSPILRQKERQGSSLIFIIVYAVLLLTLTLFVYFNLSKRIDNMSSRISNIENAQNVRFKDTATMR